MPSDYLKNVQVERIDSIETTMAHIIPEFTSNILVPIALLIYLLVLDWRMALAVLVTVPIGFGFYMLMTRGYEESYQNIMLDEATANIDPENEQGITMAIDSLTREKTILMIAHRLKTIRNAGNILVIDEGEIVQSGTHEQLMRQVGIYLRFVESREMAVGRKV